MYSFVYMATNYFFTIEIQMKPQNLFIWPETTKLWLQTLPTPNAMHITVKLFLSNIMHYNIGTMTTCGWCFEVKLH